MKKVKWLIEESAIPDDVEPMVKALEDCGIGYTCRASRQDLEQTKHLFGEDDCVVFFGSLGLAKDLRRTAKWIPGVYYNKVMYECRFYYAYLGEHIFNSNYIMLPYGDLLRQKEFLYDRLAQDRAIFIRPDRSDKLFTGKLIYKEHFDKDVDTLGFGGMNPEELIIAAEPRNIKAEWRFIVVEGKVVAGSQYRKDNRVAIEAGYPQGAFDFAQYISSVYNPGDKAWVCDVCETVGGEYKVMEVGCFSCAGLYKADRLAVVKAVSEAALKEWESYKEV